MSASRGAAAVRHVLSYLEGRVKLAKIENDRHAENHYERCWAQVFVAHYGPNLLPPTYRYPKMPTPITPPGEVPPWRQEMLAKPLRRVTARREVVIDGARPGPELIGQVEVLECGHEMPERVNFQGEPPAKWRRCAQCAKGQARLELVRKAA